MISKLLKTLPLLSLCLCAEEEILNQNNNYILFSEKTQTQCSISFDSILNEGLGSHPSISMSQKMIEGAEYSEDSAFWGYFPSPSVDVSFKSADEKQTTMRLDQPLWTGGKLDAAYDKAKAEKNEAKNGYDENQYKLIDTYLSSLKEYLLSQEKIKVLNQNKLQFMELREMLERMMKAGVLSQTDKDLLNSRIATLYADLVVTKAKFRIAKVQFEILTGRVLECDIKFDYKKVLNETTPIENYIGELLETHPSLKIMDAKIRSAISDVGASKSTLWPSLVLRAEHRSGTIYNEIEPESEDLVYMSLNIATGGGLSALSNINKAKINVSKVKYEKLNKEKELIDQLMKDYTNYITVNAQKKIVYGNIKTQTKLYESNKRLFLSQQKKWLDVVNTLSELNKQKISYAKLTEESKILEYKIALKTGKIYLTTGEVVDDL